MKKFSKMVLIGMVLSTNVHAQVIHNTTDSLDVTWNKVIDQLVDKGIDFTADKQNGIIRSRTTRRMTYGESGASCSLTPKYIISATEFGEHLGESLANAFTLSPVAGAVADGVRAGTKSPIHLAESGDSAALAYFNTAPNRREFDSIWGKKYMENNLNRNEYGVDFTTTAVPQTPTLSWGTRGKQQVNLFRDSKINYDFTILVRNVDGGSSVRVMEKYSGDVTRWIGTTSKGIVVIYSDFGVYTWNCDNSPSVLRLTF